MRQPHYASRQPEKACMRIVDGKSIHQSYFLRFFILGAFDFGKPQRGMISAWFKSWHFDWTTISSAFRWCQKFWVIVIGLAKLLSFFWDPSSWDVIKYHKKWANFAILFCNWGTLLTLSKSSIGQMYEAIFVYAVCTQNKSGGSRKEEAFEGNCVLVYTRWALNML